MNRLTFITGAFLLSIGLLFIFFKVSQPTKQRSYSEQSYTHHETHEGTTTSKKLSHSFNQTETQSIAKESDYGGPRSSNIDREQQPLASHSQSLAKQLEPFNLSSFEDLPGFLKGTDINGVIREDSEGNLIKDKGLNRLIKHFQLLLAENYAQAEVKALLGVYFDEQLSESAALQAKEFTERYFQYQDQIKTLGEDNNYANNGLDYQLEVVLEIVEQRQKLRRSYFTDEELEMYFKDLEAYEAHQIEAHRILKVPDLNQEEKQSLVRDLDNMLPLKIQQARRQTFVTDHLTTLQSESLESPDRETYLAEKYTDHFGQEAADRLLAQHQENSNWNEKRKHYLILKQSTDQKTELAPDDRAEHLNVLIQQELNLTESEIMRMQALDRIDALKIDTLSIDTLSIVEGNHTVGEPEANKTGSTETATSR